MSLIDDEGKVLGVVNVVDLLVVLFIASIGIAGVAVVTDDGGDPPFEDATKNNSANINETIRVADVEYVTTVPDPVADAATADDAELLDGELVDGPRVLESWTNESERQDYSRITLTARMPVELDNGTHLTDGRRVWIGNEMWVDMNETRFRAMVVDVDLHESRGEQTQSSARASH